MAFKVIVNVSRGFKNAYNYIVIKGVNYTEDKELHRLRNLILDAHTIFIHAKSFEVNDSQAGLYKDFMTDAIELRMEKNRESNKGSL